ncbi:MAG: RNA-directed DNA polymerase [Planctomycetes bacterium]|nr:RNA-directed DNA polymerase [Planctomycetota bacterium]
MDHSFNRRSVAKLLTPKDFYIEPTLTDENHRNEVLDEAVNIATNSHRFAPPLKVISNGNKYVYSVITLPDKLVLRKCVNNIQASLRIRFKARLQTVKELKEYLQEGSKYRIYRLDISSFFECCSTRQIAALLAPSRVTTQTSNLVESFLKVFNRTYGSGLPRGIEISPIISELYLQAFDTKLSRHQEVFYYSRFVDDFIVITSGSEDKTRFLSYVRLSLPTGLHLNHNKKRVFDIPNRSTGGPNLSDLVVANFDYLGYRFSITDTNLTAINPSKPSNLRGHQYRKVKIDLTRNKINRIKERICKTFYAYCNDSNYELLCDRIVFLSTNRNLIHKRRGRNILTGIYYSNTEIDASSRTLVMINGYYRTIVLNPQGRLGTVLFGRLSRGQKNRLLKISFVHGVRRRIFKRFSPDRLQQISRIW